MDAWHTADLANSPAPRPAPWKGTPLSSPGVDGQTPLVVAFHGEGRSPPPVGKRAWAHPGCITHHGCVSHLPGLQFPHLLMGQYHSLSGSLWGSRRWDVWNGSKRPQGSAPGVQNLPLSLRPLHQRCMVFSLFLFHIVGLAGLNLRPQTGSFSEVQGHYRSECRSPQCVV